MKTNLNDSISNALAGSSSQQPVDIAELYLLGTRKKVEAVLLEMYRQQKVCCCLIIKNSVQKSVWWLAGDVKPLGHSRMCARKRRTT